MFLTIFTPTYNRAYTLEKLYKSLQQQSEKDFEWLIVDDGSSDGTKELVDGWLNESQFSIRYIFQENAGKPAAHNRGVEEAKGEMFFCVDSDDYLSPNAVEVLKKNWQESEEDCIGMISYRIYSNGEPLTKLTDSKVKASSLKEAYDLYGLSGDTALIFNSETIKKYSFLTFEGEKFIPEGYLYDKLDKEGKLLFVREGIYICEYLPDGYTANMKKVLYRNPQGYFAYINQRLKIDKGIKAKFLDSIRYMAMAIAKKKKGKIKNSVYPFWALVAYIPGWLLYLRDYRRYENEKNN